MINVYKIKSILNDNNINIDIDKIKDILSCINIDEIKKTESKKIRYEIWDKKSSINGANAKEIIKSRNYKIDNAFLVYIDNVLTYFQDHNPYKSGYVKIKKREVNEIAQKFCEERLEERILNIIIRKVIFIYYNNKK